MHLSRAEFDELDEAKLLSFVGRSIAEGHHLDYKSQLSGPPSPPGLTIAALSPAAREEFLKDVSSFANANGGLILIGVEEPSEGTSAIDQTPGVADGEALAKALENVAASGLEPRILGLQVRPIRLAAPGRSVVAVYIPPSAGKPHVFRVGRYLGAFIRHRETCQPMTAFELRESVLSSLGAEARAAAYLEQQERNILSQFGGDDETRLLLQAAPLVRPEQLLDVLTERVREALMFGDEGIGPDRSGSLRSTVRPEATVDGIVGKPNRKAPAWLSEVHRNGFVGVVWRVENWDGEIAVGPDFKRLLFNFGAMLARVLEALEFQSPYLVRARFFNTVELRLWTSHNTRAQRKLGDPSILFPDDVIASPGEFDRVAAGWWTILHNAYGIDAPEV